MTDETTQPEKTDVPVSGPPWWKPTLAGWTFMAIALVYVVLRVAILAGVEPIEHSDTRVFERIGKNADTLFGNARPWAYPAFVEHFDFQYGSVVFWQRLIGIGAWLVAAFGLGLLFKRQAARFTVVSLILLVSLNLNIIHWDASVLSESLTVSLFILILGVFAFSFFDFKANAYLWLPLPILLFFFGGLRDANNLLLPGFAILLLLEIARRMFLFGKARLRASALLVLVPGAIAFLGTLGAYYINTKDLERSERGWSNATNVMCVRALVRFEETPTGPTAVLHENHARWFVEEGDVPREIILRAGRNIYAPPDISRENRQWLRENMRDLWGRFLDEHRGWAIDTVFSAPPLYALEAPEYLGLSAEEVEQRWSDAWLAVPNVLHGLTYTLFGWLLGFALLQELLLLGAFAGLVLWAVATFRKRPQLRPAWFALLMPLCATGLAGIAAAMLGDAIEDWRHAHIGLVAVQLLLPLLVGIAVETTPLPPVRKTQPSPESNGPEPEGSSGRAASDGARVTARARRQKSARRKQKP